MINFSIELTSKRWDYRFDKLDRFQAVLPYLYPKLSGDWVIELIGVDIKEVRNILDHVKVPEYVELIIVLSQDVLAQLQLERPNLVEQKKTTWEYYNDLIAELPIYIESKAASMLYNRLPRNRTMLKQALESLVKTCEAKESITVADVKGVTLNHRVYYANQVINAFGTHDKNRWSIYNTYEKDLGRRYAFYALKKYITKLLHEKNKYLHNEDYQDRNVEVIDAYSIMFLYGKFMSAKPEQLICIFSEFESRRKGDATHAIL